MRISTGIAEISYASGFAKTSRAEKVYIWPVYGEGRIERIQKVARRTEGNAIYSKPLPEEREKLIEIMNSASSYRYAENGYKSATPLLTPGTFFDALV